MTQQFQLIGFTTPSYVDEWLATRDPAHLLLMAYHGNHRVAVFTLKDGAELAKRGESPQFEGTMVEPQVGDVIRRPDVPTLPVTVAVDAQQRAEVPEGFVLVPMEPTLEMLWSAKKAATEYQTQMGLPDTTGVGAYDHYVALIAAAPAPKELAIPKSPDWSAAPDWSKWHFYREGGTPIYLRCRYGWDGIWSARPSSQEREHAPVDPETAAQITALVAAGRIEMPQPAEVGVDDNLAGFVVRDSSGKDHFVPVDRTARNADTLYGWTPVFYRAQLTEGVAPAVPLCRQAEEIIRQLSASVAVGSDGEWVSVRREARDAAVQAIKDLASDLAHVFKSYCAASDRATALTAAGEGAAPSELQCFAGEIYQVLGALDAPAHVLDQASAAANGDPLPHETLLPFVTAAGGRELAIADAIAWLHSHSLYSLLTDIQNGIDSPATAGVANDLLVRLDRIHAALASQPEQGVPHD